MSNTTYTWAIYKQILNIQKIDNRETVIRKIERKSHLKKVSTKLLLSTKTTLITEERVHRYKATGHTLVIG